MEAASGSRLLMGFGGRSYETSWVGVTARG